MTRQGLLVVCATLLMRAAASAQSVELGFKAGIDWPTVSNFTGPLGGLDAGRTRDVIGGVVVGVPISERIALQPEVLFVRKGTTLTASDPELDLRVSIRLDYLEFPALVRVWFAGPVGRRPYILVGPSLGYRLQAQEQIETLGRTSEADLDPGAIKRFEASLVAAGGVRFGRIAAEGRYSHGLTTADARGADVKNRVIAILVGFHF